MWEKSKRVCADRYFPYYFQLAVPEGEVSNAEVAKALAECTSVEQFVASLEKLNSSGKFASFIDKLRHHLSELSKDKLRTILNSIFVYGDNVSLQGTGAMGLISDHLRFTSWLLLDLLELMGDGRFEELIAAMQGKPAVYTVVSVTMLFQNIASEGDQSVARRYKFPDLNLQVVDRMKAAAVSVIDLAAKEHRLRAAPVLPAILYRWKEWAGKAQVDAWIETEYLKDPHTAVTFSSLFLHQTRSFALTDKVARVKDRIAWKGIAELVDLRRLADLVNKSVDSELTEKERETKALFLAGLQKLNSGVSIETLDSPVNFD